MHSLKNTDNHKLHPIILSGCSGGGKSTLLEELATRGRQTVKEAGRRVVQLELHNGGKGLPWVNIQRFCELAGRLKIKDYEEAIGPNNIVFMDRSILDLFLNLKANQLALPNAMAKAVETQNFHKTVFFVPPWKEIFHDDGQRNKTYEDAIKEYEILLNGYQNLGYKVEILAKASVEERADFIETYVAKSYPETRT